MLKRISIIATFLITLLVLVTMYSITWSPIFLFTKYRKYRRWIIAQAKFETAAFTSNNFRNFNNAFGMGKANVRKRWQSDSIYILDPGVRELATYFAPGQSLVDFLLYLNYIKMPTDFTTLEQYILYLKSKGYFTANTAAYFKGVESYLL